MTRKSKRILAVILTIALLLGTIPFGAVAFAADNSKISLDGLDDFVSRIRELEDDTTVAKDDSPPEQQGGFRTASAKSFELKRLIVKSDSKLDDMGAVAKAEGFLGLHVFQYKDEKSTRLAFNAFRQNKDVEWVQADTRCELSSLSPTVDEQWLTADGSTFLSWGADYIGAGSFIESLQGKDLPLVTVAVIDTGIDTDHELFGGFYDAATNPDGRILSYGTNYSYTGVFGDPEDENGHGTHVSGTITEMTPSNVKILPIKILNNEGFCSNLQICMGILYAVEMGADIANMSLGGSRDEETYLMDYTLSIASESDVAIMVAAGNESTDSQFMSPAMSDYCITVGAMTPDLDKAWFSNYGDPVDVAAPGTNILSAAIDGGYISMNGTSMATPHVSAVAALYKTENPNLTAAELKDIIVDNAVDIGIPGKDIYFGNGLAYAMPQGKSCPGTVEISYGAEPYLVESGYNYFHDSVTVTLKVDGCEKIFYTVDGTNPLGGNAQVYSGPITVTNSSALNAVGVSRTGLSVPIFNAAVIVGSDPVYTIVKSGDNTVASYGIVPSKVTVSGTKVGDYAFKGQRYIKEVTFDDSVKAVGNGAFMGCQSLQTLDLNNVTSVGTNAFTASGLSDLKADNLKTIEAHAFYRVFIASLELPNVTTVGKNAFQDNELETVSLPKAETICDYAFYNNENLTVASIPNAKTVGDYAFYSTSLESAIMPEVVRIGDRAFSSTYIDNLNVPKLKEIGNEAFYGIPITSLSLPSAETVGNSSFADSALETVDLPNAKKVEYAAFAGTYIENLYCPKLVEVEDLGFYMSDLLSVDLPSVETVGEYSFSANANLEKFNAPKLKTIDNYAFKDCESLMNIALPSAETIGNLAFNNSGLEVITLPQSVRYIGLDAFDHDFYLDDETGEKVLVSPLIVGYAGSYAETYANENGIRFAPIGTTYKVVFLDANGKVLKTENVAAGEDATAPKAPSRFLKVFMGWDREYTCVTSDIVIQPIYVSVFELAADYISLMFQYIKYYLFGWLIPVDYTI